MEWIPQAPPFVMIDQLLDGMPARASFLVRQGHLFVDEGMFTEPGIMEHMAQTSAAGMGYEAAQEGKQVPVGFIGAIKRWELYELPSVGAEIITTAEVRNRIGNALVVSAVTMLGKRPIASAEFTIFLQENS